MYSTNEPLDLLPVSRPPSLSLLCSVSVNICLEVRPLGCKAQRPFDGGSVWWCLRVVGQKGLPCVCVCVVPEAFEFFYTCKRKKKVESLAFSLLVLHFFSPFGCFFRVSPADEIANGRRISVNIKSVCFQCSQ